MNTIQIRKWLGYWLIAGSAMIILQVVLGGITRLTGSGLSITEWNVLLGWIPPITQAQWQQAFEHYQQLAQFKTLNADMDVSSFKNIFFWEYLHRLWARLLMVVFIIPFVYFVIKGAISNKLYKQLFVVFLLGALQGLIGWLMVKTGIGTERLWVSPLSLGLHLSVAFFTYCFLLWLVFDHYFLPVQTTFDNNKSENKFNGTLIILIITSLQIMLGALMAGSHAALFFPTWPLMNGAYLPEATYNNDLSLIKNILENVTLIQFMHRNMAYLVTIAIIIYWYNCKNKIMAHQAIILILLLQVILGISTLIFSVGKIPVVLGVLHQIGAIVLISFIVRLLHYYYNLNLVSNKN